jgi:hypothetical protein
MASAQGDAKGERIQANRKIIWGDADYDLDVEPPTG